VSRFIELSRWAKAGLDRSHHGTLHSLRNYFGVRLPVPEHTAHTSLPLRVVMCPRSEWRSLISSYASLTSRSASAEWDGTRDGTSRPLLLHAASHWRITSSSKICCFRLGGVRHSFVSRTGCAKKRPIIGPRGRARMNHPRALLQYPHAQRAI